MACWRPFSQIRRSSSPRRRRSSFPCGLLIAGIAILVGTPAMADDLLKPISVSPDGHFLQQPDGRPFFWLADTAWEIFYRLDRDEVDRYLKDRADKGFTVIQAVATGKLDSKGLDAPNSYGQLPFVDRDPTRPNELYFKHVDWVIGRAGHYGLRVALLPTWGQMFVGVGPEERVFDRANAQIYGRWLAERYRGKGVIWVLGGDITPLWSVQPKNGAYKELVDFRPVFDAMAAGIISGDGGNPFITYHPTSVSGLGAALPRTSLFFANRSWLDMNMLQTGHAMRGPGAESGADYIPDVYIHQWNAALNHLPVRAEYDSTPVRPVVDAETSYEGGGIAGPLVPSARSYGVWEPHQVRGALYRALFAGAAGHTYGHVSVWDFNDPVRSASRPIGVYDRGYAGVSRLTWPEALGASGANQMRHGKSLMLSRPYFTRVPDQSVIVGANGDGEAHIGATRDRDGSYLMVYLPQGQPVTVDLTKLAGSAGVGWWYDPRTGAARRIDGELHTNQPFRFTPPSQGPDQDWILVLDDASRNYPPPGKTAP